MNRIQKILLLLAIYVGTATSLKICSEHNATITLSRSDTDQTDKAIALPLLLILTTDSDILRLLADELQKILRVTGHIEPRLLHAAPPRYQKDITTLAQQGSAFALYLSCDENTRAVCGRLYNTVDGTMVVGVNWAYRSSYRLWAQQIATVIWKALYNNAGSFTTQIAYIKRDTRPGKPPRHQLCTREWDGENERVIVSRTTPLVAPEWFCIESNKPVTPANLVFSEFTPANVRLMRVKRKGVCERLVDLPGTTVGVSIGTSNEFIYCRSGNIWRCAYDSDRGQTVHRKLISPDEPAACPIQLTSGDIIYCCKGRIYLWNGKTQQSHSITQGAFATSPAIHEPSGKIVYAQKRGGYMQLILQDRASGRTRQLTHGPTNKVDPSFSRCGTFIAYTEMEGQKSIICTLNLLTGTVQQLTNPESYCLCPAWSS